MPGYWRQIWRHLDEKNVRDTQNDDHEWLSLNIIIYNNSNKNKNNNNNNNNNDNDNDNDTDNDNVNDSDNDNNNDDLPFLPRNITVLHVQWHSAITNPAGVYPCMVYIPLFSLVQLGYPAITNIFVVNQIVRYNGSSLLTTTPL